MRFIHHIPFLVLTVLSGCAKGGLHVASQISKKTETIASCETYHEKINQILTQALLDERPLPTPQDLEKTLHQDLSVQLRPLIPPAVNAYRLLTEETKKIASSDSKHDLIEVLMALEIGDETTPEKKRLKYHLQSLLNEMAMAAKLAGLTCAEPSPAADTDLSGAIPKEETPSPILISPVEGALKVLKTAYQSCQAERIPAMDQSTTSLHQKAIRITGKHPNGVGQKRMIGDLSLLQQTHYYIREGIESDPSCFDVPRNPMIYDYGGKPYSTPADDSSLNLFKDAGTGTSVLGIDCSGYIFSAMAASGLRLSPGKKLKAFQVNGVNARMYMEPASNGLSCLEPVESRSTDTIKSGDILASTGHIVMLERVGEDPFGIAGIKTIADCKASMISVKDFDFDILHSAPIKNGIGINRAKASYYFQEGTSMRAALISYAIAACRARFGSPSLIKPSSARLVRHRMTADCVDQPIFLDRESCVQSCPLAPNLSSLQR